MNRYNSKIQEKEESEDEKKSSEKNNQKETPLKRKKILIALNHNAKNENTINIDQFFEKRQLSSGSRNSKKSNNFANFENRQILVNNENTNS